MPIAVPQRLVWTRNPEVPRGINWGHPLAQRLRHFIYSAPMPYCAVTAANSPAGQVWGSVSNLKSAYGSSRYFDRASDYFYSHPALNVAGIAYTLSLIHI